MDFEFRGEIWFWRGPAPHFFVTVPEHHCHAIQAMSRSVTYGWGMIPATVQIGKTVFKTSLFPKNGGYIVPLKASARRAEDLDQGDTVTLRLTVRYP